MRRANAITSYMSLLGSRQTLIASRLDTTPRSLSSNGSAQELRHQADEVEARGLQTDAKKTQRSAHGGNQVGRVFCEESIRISKPMK